MITSLFSVFLALLALGFIIFIHELGHFWMARRCGMRVEAFGIGFGKPIFTFLRNGVRWNIGWLPFGGYVKIAGMEKENGVDPKDIPDGFFGSSPVSRVLVALAGPLANVLLAFVLFVAVYAMGGRIKSFSEVTNRIGWVDPQSELYNQGVRPGDIIVSYDNRPVRVASDHMQAPMTAKDRLLVEGLKRSEKGYTPFKLPITPYLFPKGSDSALRVSGVLAPANFLIWTPELVGASSVSPTGIQPKDRIVWVNGERIYSSYQLSTLLNDSSVLVTVHRSVQGANQLLQLRVPRVAVSECKLDFPVRNEISDWQYAAGLKAVKSSQLFILPYNLTGQGVVENALELFDDIRLEQKLLPGDAIIAVQGMPVTNSVEILKEMQKHEAVVIVEKMSFLNPVSIKEATQAFDDDENLTAFTAALRDVGSGKAAVSGPYRLLKPVPLTSMDAQDGKKFFILGLQGVSDLPVLYNPGPLESMEGAVRDMARTLSALVSGYLSPKWLSGPIGMVQIIQKQTSSSLPDSCYWVGLISLYLALSNLLPLPVLDGGYILLALFEIVTGKRFSAKVLEKLVMIFTIALVLLILFVTYHDIVRVLSGMFG